MNGVLLLLLLDLFKVTLSVSTSCVGGISSYWTNDGEISIEDYDRDALCTYEIRLVDSSRWILLEWESFKVDGDMPHCKDYVKVYTGCYGYVEVGKFCSNNLVDSVPHNIYSREGCMKIEVLAAGSTTQHGLGFSAKYTSGLGSVSDISYCTSAGINYGSSGVIVSPGWPQIKEYYLMGGCDWLISGSSDDVIQLNFFDINLENDDKSCFAKPYLSIEGSKSMTTSDFSERKYCGTLEPLTINTDYYALKIRMKLDYYTAVRNRGLAVGYVIYKSNAKFGENHTGTITAIVVCVVILFVVTCIAALILRRKKARQHVQRCNQSVELVDPTAPNGRELNSTIEQEPLHRSPSTSVPVGYHPVAASAPVLPEDEGCLPPPPDYSTVTNKEDPPPPYAALQHTSTHR